MTTQDLLGEELSAAGFTIDDATGVISLRGAKVTTTKIHRNAPELRWIAEITLDGCRSMAYGHDERAALLTLGQRVNG